MNAKDFKKTCWQHLHYLSSLPWLWGLVVSSSPAELWVVRSNPVRVWGGSFFKQNVDLCFSATNRRKLRQDREAHVYVPACGYERHSEFPIGSLLCTLTKTCTSAVEATPSTYVPRYICEGNTTFAVTKITRSGYQSVSFS
jgi:hypothetical protein